MQEARVRFEDSDAYTFFNAMRMGVKDLDVARHFVKSMKEWDKTLLNSLNKNKAPERD